MKRRSEAQPLGKLKEEEKEEEDTNTSAASSSPQQSRRSQPKKSTAASRAAAAATATATATAAISFDHDHNADKDTDTDITMEDEKSMTPNKKSISSTSRGPINTLLARTRITIHPDPSKPCYINDLVTVELHSVMHFLDTSGLLKFARTQKKIQSAASTSGAWRHQPPFELDFKPGWYQGERVKSSLLMHSPAGIALRAQIGDPYYSEEISEIEESDIIELKQIPHIKKATIGTPRISEAQLRHILFGLASNHVQELYLTIGQRFDCTSELIRYNYLTRLRIDLSARDDEEGVSENEVQSLHLIPNLTELALTDISIKDGQRSCTYAIEKCTRLTNLQLGSPALGNERFREFFTSPNLAQLECLYISGEWRGSTERSVKLPTKADYIAAFTAMKSLRLLVLDWDSCVRGLLVGLAAISSSRLTLRIKVGYEVTKSIAKYIQDFLSKHKHISVQLRGCSPASVKKHFSGDYLERIQSQYDSLSFGEFETVTRDGPKDEEEEQPEDEEENEEEEPEEEEEEEEEMEEDE